MNKTATFLKTGANCSLNSAAELLSPSDSHSPPCCHPRSTQMGAYSWSPPADRRHAGYWVRLWRGFVGSALGEEGGEGEVRTTLTEPESTVGKGVIMSQMRSINRYKLALCTLFLLCKNAS